jgi:DNA modification methylase
VWATYGDSDDEGFLRCSADETDDPSSGINPSNTLNARSARDDDDEKHLCPLQLEVIRRAVRLWSNPGDIVWSPFAGIGSEGYVALQEGRRFVGAELKASYYGQAVRNLQSVEFPAQASLFGSAAGGG